MAKGGLKKWLNEREQEALDIGLTPLEFLIKIYRDETLALEVRIDAAARAAPYISKKAPQAVELSGPDGKPIQQEDVGAARTKLAGLLTSYAPGEGEGPTPPTAH